METISIILMAIFAVFLFFIIFKQILPKRLRNNFCVICFSASSTWIILLILYFLEIFNDKIIISLLIGMSITGVYYYLESHVKENKRIFRLPFVLTMLFLFYSILERFFVETLVIVLAVWFIFILLFVLNGKKEIKNFSKKIIECCKKW